MEKYAIICILLFMVKGLNMNIKEEITRNYFKAWIDNDISIIEKVFSEDILYVESWGPAYIGINQLKAWFMDWHKNNKVVIWDIKDIIILNNRVICEWYFKYQHKEKIEDFNGISLIRFDNCEKIEELKEFMSTLPIRYPYCNVNSYDY
ncbi:SnoaL-like domain-containing protein [Clostridium cavendishii DSM 21758]|uniref:SnoaL-like domain-containing protein n=1 Tax=Clostridium cavendishii DSM 21758 TaxID=1121302 RepID=A0A1M6FC48_9CLOT|nr:nuclear transport factor 2 family protein [Clostridium cavendishii]SHI95216.1 SnoaL-like domain-containing protein [Clostridium cavendishii DSM 21758]